MLHCHLIDFHILCLEKRERIEFAVTVNKYDRRFKVGHFQFNLTSCTFDCILLLGSSSGGGGRLYLSGKLFGF